MNYKYEQILRLIIGENDYKDFINKVFNDMYSKIDSTKNIVQSYCKVILALWTNNEIVKNRIKKVKIYNKTIEIEELSKKYKKEIDLIKEYNNYLIKY